MGWKFLPSPSQFIERKLQKVLFFVERKMAGTKLEKLETVDLGERGGIGASHFHGHSHPCNQISTETIAIFSVTTSILWTQSYMLGSTFSTDGSTLNTTSQGRSLHFLLFHAHVLKLAFTLMLLSFPI